MGKNGERIYEIPLLNKIIGELKGENFEDTMFFTRLGSNFKSLYKNFRLLYGDRIDFEEKLKKLVKVMAESYGERSEELKQIDIKREERSGWFLSPEYVGMMMYVDRFSGDIKGLEEKIGYLKELGINYVHLMPLLKKRAGENDGGYAVSDYRKVDEEYGTTEDLLNIGKKLRENNMLLVLDFVLNHTADDHEWAKRALAGEKTYQDYYYMYDTREIPDKFEESLPEVFPEMAPGNFTYREEIKKWVFTVFNNYQWDLNYTNPDVFIEMTKILFYLGNCGVDVLRLDAVAFMWKKLGTNSQNEAEAHIILQTMKSCTKVVMPGVIFKAEAIVQPNDIVKYLGHGAQSDECEIAYNASFMVFLWDAIATKNTKLLTKGLENMPRIPEGTTWINYVRCHDDIGLGFADTDAVSVGYTPTLHRRFLIDYYTGKFYGSMASGAPFMENPKTGDARISGSLASLAGLEKSLESGNKKEIEKAVRRILLLHSAIMSFGGIPLIYYGDEIGIINDYSYINDNKKKNDNRWMHRPKIDWEKMEKRNIEGTIENMVFANIKNMIRLRKETPEFYGENNYELIRTDNMSVFAYLREKEENKTLVVMNFSDKEEEIDNGILSRVDFKTGVYDLISGKNINLKNGKIRMEPYGFMWLKEKK